MSRPWKRPRLHFMCSVSPPPDAEVNAARKRNDLLLKTRFEAVFERYERDFTGIGDELAFLTDEVIVDNGHLRSMQNDRDTGAGRPQAKDTVYDGKRLLRAMTAAPSECASSASGAEEVEEVLQSIETMADNVFLNDYSSDDELFDPNAEARLRHDDDAKDKNELSEVDSLFDPRPDRSPSVDSLFDPTPKSITYRAGRRSPFFAAIYGESNGLSLPYLTPTEEDVLQRHRSLIREEVRNVLNEHKEKKEAKLEPAWRIPVRLSSSPHTPKSASLPRIVSLDRRPSQLGFPDSEEDEDEDEDDENGSEKDDPGESIWRPAKRIRRARKVVAAERNLKRIRGESEDPLQEGFSSDAEPPPRGLSRAISSTRSQTGTSSKAAVVSNNPGDTNEEDMGETSTGREDGEKEEVREEDVEETEKANTHPVRTLVDSFGIDHTSLFSGENHNRESSAAPAPTIIVEGCKKAIDNSNIDRAEKTRVMGRAIQENFCDYCQHQYTTSGSVRHHWDRTVNDHFQGFLSSDDPHNIPILRSIRFAIERRDRPGKLKVKDFRALVELHEGAGLSFDQIARSKALWTTKPGNELGEEYAKVRRLAGDGVPLTHQYPFAGQDKERILEAFAKNPEMTMHGLVRVAGRLIKRPKAPQLTVLDLGHYLADVFLTDFHRTGPTRQVSEQPAPPTLLADFYDQMYHATLPPEHETQHVQSVAEVQNLGFEQDIKIESDDKLFYPR